MTEEKTKMDLRSKAFWMKVASVFTLIWIPVVLMYTQGQADHWLSNTMFLGPMLVWAVVLIVFRKSNEIDQ